MNERDEQQLRWELTTLTDAALRLEQALVNERGQPTDDSELATAHVGLRIAFRRPGRYADWLADHPEVHELERLDDDVWERLRWHWDNQP